MPITVTCKCRKSFQAPDLLAGKTVKCPNCASPLAIPSTKAQESLFDELSDLAAAAEFAPAADSRLGTGAGGRKGGMGLGSSPHPLQMHRPASSLPLAAIVGGGVAVVAIVVVLFIFLMPGDREGSGRRAGRGTASPERSQPADAGARPERTRLQTGQSRERSTAGTVGPTSPGNEQVATGAGGSIFDSLGSLARSITGGADGAGANAAAAGATGAELAGQLDPKLRPGLLQWYGGGKLVSTRRSGEIDMHELHYGWMVGLLPHLGYQEHYDQFDFEKPWHDEKNLEHASKEIPEFLNPADSRKEYAGYRYTGMALTHVIGISGVEDGRNVVAAALPRSDPRAGIFGYEDIAAPRDVKDGTSRTVMMIGAGELACPWVQSGGSTIRGAREPHFGELNGFGTAGGPGKGAVAVMADGSVRWIKADVDPQVFRAMCTIGGGD